MTGVGSYGKLGVATAAYREAFIGIVRERNSMTTATTEALPYQDALDHAVERIVSNMHVFGRYDLAHIIREAMQTAHRDGMLAAAKIARKYAGLSHTVPHSAAAEAVADAIEAAA